MILLKALLLAIILALVGLVLGPFAGLILMPAPADPCGMHALIPLAIGAGIGVLGGAAVGFVLGLFI